MGCSLERELPGFLKIFYSGGWWAGGLLLNTPAFQIDCVIVRGSQHSGLFVRDGTAMLFENFLLWRMVGWWATFKHTSFQIDCVIVRVSQYSGLIIRERTAILFENLLLWRMVGWWATF